MSSFVRLAQAWVDLVKNRKVTPNYSNQIAGAIDSTTPHHISTFEMQQQVKEKIASIRGYPLEEEENQLFAIMPDLEVRVWFYKLKRYNPNIGTNPITGDRIDLPAVYFNGLRLLQLINNVAREISNHVHIDEILFDITKSQEIRLRDDQFRNSQEYYMAKMGRLISDNETIALADFAELASTEFTTRLDMFEKTLRDWRRDSTKNGMLMSKYQYKTTMVSWMRSLNLILDNCAPTDSQPTPYKLVTNQSGVPPRVEYNKSFKEDLKRDNLHSVTFPCDENQQPARPSAPVVNDPTNDPKQPAEDPNDQRHPNDRNPREASFRVEIQRIFSYARNTHEKLCKEIQIVNADIYQLVLDSRLNYQMSDHDKYQFIKARNDASEAVEFLDSLLLFGKCPAQGFTPGLMLRRPVTRIINDIIRRLDEYGAEYDTFAASLDTKLKLAKSDYKDVNPARYASFIDLESYARRIASRSIFADILEDVDKPTPSSDVPSKDGTSTPVFPVTVFGRDLDTAEITNPQFVGIFNRYLSIINHLLDIFNSTDTNIQNIRAVAFEQREQFEQAKEDYRNIKNSTLPSTFDETSKVENEEKILDVVEQKIEIAFNITAQKKDPEAYSFLSEAYDLVYKILDFGVRALQVYGSSKLIQGISYLAISNPYARVTVDVFGVFFSAGMFFFPSTSEIKENMKIVGSLIDIGAQDEALLSIISSMIAYNNIFVRWFYWSESLTSINQELETLFIKAIAIPGKEITTAEQLEKKMVEIGGQLPFDIKLADNVNYFVAKVSGLTIDTKKLVIRWANNALDIIKRSFGWVQSIVLIAGAGALIYYGATSFEGKSGTFLVIAGVVVAGGAIYLSKS